MKVKVCGMREADNIREISALQPDYMGFIFYRRSPRYVSPESLLPVIEEIPPAIIKTGIFVNQPMEEVVSIAKQLNLQAVQIHGHETPDDCHTIKQAMPDVEIIKAFGIHTLFEFASVEPFVPCVSYFLFDNAGKQGGGTGNSFSWPMLEAYPFKISFFLSGGIGPENVLASISVWQQANYMEGIDINSKVEISPGLKNPSLVKNIMETVRNRPTRIGFNT